MHKNSSFLSVRLFQKSAVLAQAIACLPLVQRVPGSMPGVIESFIMKIFNSCARRGRNLQLLADRLNSKSFRSLYVKKEYCAVDSDTSAGWGRESWRPLWC